MANNETPRSRKKWYRFQNTAFDKKKMLRRVRKAERTTLRHAHKFIVRRWRNAREVGRIIALWVVSVAVLIGAVGLQVFWNQQAYRTTVGATGGTYAEATLGSVNSLNPIYATSPAEKTAAQLLFSRLMTYDGAGTLNYDAAQSVKVSDDNKQYTVKLRPDIKWHDGQSLTADDIVFTIATLQDPLSRSQIRGWDAIKVEQLDTLTVRFTLKAPYAPFAHALTFPILPKHILGTIDRSELQENAFSSNPVGSGPFSFRMLQSIDGADNRKVVHLTANESYYRGAPKLARFQIYAYPDRAAIKKALAVNEVSAAAGLTRTDLKDVASRYGTLTQSVRSGVYAFLNEESDLLSDVNVRKALRYGTNVKEIRQKLGDGVVPLSLPYTNDQLSDASGIAEETYDVEKAKQLLDEAGWKLEGNIRKKDGRELRLSVITAKDEDYTKALETLIGQWRQLSVIVDDRVVDTADPTQGFAQSVLQQRAYDVLLYQIILGGDPDVYEYWHSSQAVARGRNLSNYTNAVADDILSSARSTNNQSLRDAKHISFAKEWVKDAPAIGLYQVTEQYVYSKSVRGIDTTQTLIVPENRYYNVSYWTVGDTTVYKTP